VHRAGACNTLLVLFKAQHTWHAVHAQVIHVKFHMLPYMQINPHWLQDPRRECS
jgi:hypothetical protein